MSEICAARCPRIVVNHSDCRKQAIARFERANECYGDVTPIMRTSLRIEQMADTAQIVKIRRLAI